MHIKIQFKAILDGVKHVTLHDMSTPQKYFMSAIRLQHQIMLDMKWNTATVYGA